MKNKKPIAQGKTKIIWPNGQNLYEVIVENTNFITAGDGVKRNEIPYKALYVTQVTCNVFEVLEDEGLNTHYLGRNDDTSFVARRAYPLPLECVARGIYAGSLAKRKPGMEIGTKLKETVFEMFEKDDRNHDPLLEFNFEDGTVTRRNAGIRIDDPASIISVQPISESRFAWMTYEKYAHMERETIEGYEILRDRWARLEYEFWDYKIEFGFDYETGRLLIIDGIGPDECRLISPEGKSMDKDPYRKYGEAALAEVQQNYETVAILSAKL